MRRPRFPFTRTELTMSEAQQPARPYFLLEGVDFSTLPAAVESVLDRDRRARLSHLGTRSALRARAVDRRFFGVFAHAGGIRAV